ncbi:SGT1 protein-domain-containing protein [Melampsora americana]|nr:SGT1 protein-domain-containing protein [Melampsora americana]
MEINPSSNTISALTTEFKIKLIHHHQSNNLNLKQEESNEIKLNQIQTCLNSYLTSNQHFSSIHSNQKNQYIWHTSKPTFSINFEQNSIHGTLFYSDSIQDEWYLVWCLFQLSQAFSDSIIINVYDDDGEFLLIEAADYLPKWITPNLSKGRVWIKSGALHLIPLNHPLALDYQDQPLPNHIAFEIFKNPSDTIQTIASHQINQAIQLRLDQSTPHQLIQNHLYNTQAYLHQDISRVLRLNPNLIGLAIQAFIDKDQKSFKVCQTMTRFPPNPIATDQIKSNQIILTPLNLTRPLYASLINHQQTFYPPKPFEKSQWFQSLDFHQSFKSSTLTQEFKRRLIGIKINCGFEILYHQELNRFQNHLSKLKSIGYFESEVQGSKEYDLLEVKAKETFLNQKSTSTSLIDLLETSMDQEDDRIDEPGFESESDEWLNLNEEELRRLFQQDQPQVNDDDESEQHPKVTVEEEKMAKEEVKKMVSFAERMESFVNGQGSLEGALHSDDEHSSDENEDEDDSDDDDSEQEELRADLGDLKRMKHSRNWTQAKMSDYDDHQSKRRLESLVPSLDQTEWGSKSNQDETSIPLDRDLNNQSSDLKSNSQVSKFESILKSNSEPPDFESNPQSSKCDSKLQSSGFTKESYDGVCEDETSDEDEEEEFIKGETSKMEMNDEMEIEMEMDAERDEFLNFAREALGLSEDQYQEILNSRKERGAYVPPPIKVSKDTESIKNLNNLEKSQVDIKGKRSVRFNHEEINRDLRSKDEPIKVNENLNNFESMMDAIESELEIQKLKKGGPIPNNLNGPNFNPQSNLSSDEEDEEYDSKKKENENRMEDLGMKEIDEMMKNELESIGLIEKEDQIEAECKMISGFLNSFHSQSNSNGPVGNLAGRVGINLLEKFTN